MAFKIEKKLGSTDISIVSQFIDEEISYAIIWDHGSGTYSASTLLLSFDGNGKVIGCSAFDDDGQVWNWGITHD